MEETEQKPTPAEISLSKKKREKPIDAKAKPKIDELIDNGIPLERIVLAKAVRSFRETVEFAFYWPSDRDKNLILPRKAKIWLTPAGVLLEQMGRYKIIPHGNVLEADVL